MRTARLVLLLGCLAAAHGVPSTAQTTRSGADAARAMQQLQQLAAERSALQAENAKLKQQLDEVQKKFDAAGAQQESLTRRAQNAEAASARLAAGSAQTNESAARTRAQMDEIVVRFRETAEALKAAETERAALRQQSQAAERLLATCREHNAELLVMNEEVLVRLENTGFWSRLAADEPFTRLKRTQLENLAGEYRQKAAELAEPVPTVATP